MSNRIIRFGTHPWTVRDALLAQRLERNNQDLDAWVALLISRSDASEDEILALSLPEFVKLGEQLGETLKEMMLLQQLSQAWSHQTDED